MSHAFVKTQDTDALDVSPPETNSGNREFWAALVVLTMIYAVAIFFEGQRFVWFDELCTFYIARAPSLKTLWHWVLEYDNNPPTVYLLARFSMKVFGPGALGLRLPSILEFYVGSMGMLLYLRRKAGVPIAVFGVLILWGSASFRYATEARPYALVFMCFSVLLLSWDKAVRSQSRKLALAGIAVSSTGLLLAHVFAALCLLPFLVAEIIRYRRHREPDYPLYAAFALPLTATVLYIPLIRVYHGLILWPQFRASFRQVALFYFDGLDTIAKALLAACFVGIAFLPASGSGLLRKTGGPPKKKRSSSACCSIPCS